MIETPTPESDLEAVGDWLGSVGWKQYRLERLPGDVSTRRYYRATGVDLDTAVVAFYPPDLLESCRKFTVTAGLLDRVGVPSPKILAADCESGFMILEDMGRETLFGMRSHDWPRLLPWVENGKDLIRRIQKIPVGTVVDLNPGLNAALLRQELDQTWALFLEPHDLVGDNFVAQRFHDALDQLCDSLGSDLGIACHRDFMARNLVPTVSAPKLAVLDHQDLRPGPRYYDLASLLNDSLFPPPEIERQLLVDVITTVQDHAAYHQAAAQRTLKAIGTFVWFSRRGNNRHLHLIPPTLDRALHHLEELPEFAELLSQIGGPWRSFDSDSSGKSYKER